MTETTRSAPLLLAARDGARALDEGIFDEGLAPILDGLSMESPIDPKFEGRVWAALRRRFGATGGVDAGRAAPRGVLGALEYAMRTSPRVGDALSLLVDASHHWYGRPIVQLEEKASRVDLVYHPPHAMQHRWATLPPELLLTLVVSIVSDMNHGAPVVHGASVLRATATTAPALSAAWQVPVGTLSSAYRLSFATPVLNRASAEADPRLHQIVRRLVGAGPPRRATFARRVRDEIGRSLDRSGQVSLDRVAHQLGISRRVLQGRLRQEGCTFRQVLSDERAIRAQTWLRQTELGFDEIAERLGFADVRSFYRYFKRAIGFTPAVYRRERSSSVPPHDRGSDPPSDRSVA